VGPAPTPTSNPNPNPSQFVREIEDTVGLSLGRSNLVTHEPRCAGSSVSDQIGKRHAALADDLIAEDEAVVAELKAEEEIVIIGVAWRVRKPPQIEPRLVVPLGVAAIGVAFSVRYGSLSLLALLRHFPLRILAVDEDGGVNCELLEKVEGSEVLARDEFHLHASGFGFHCFVIFWGLEKI